MVLVADLLGQQLLTHLASGDQALNDCGDLRPLDLDDPRTRSEYFDDSDLNRAEAKNAPLDRTGHETRTTDRPVFGPPQR